MIHRHQARMKHLEPLTRAVLEEAKQKVETSVTFLAVSVDNRWNVNFYLHLVLSKYLILCHWVNLAESQDCHLLLTINLKVKEGTGTKHFRVSGWRVSVEAYGDLVNTQSLSNYVTPIPWLPLETEWGASVMIQNLHAPTEIVSEKPSQKPRVSLGITPHVQFPSINNPPYPEPQQPQFLKEDSDTKMTDYKDQTVSSYQFQTKQKIIKSQQRKMIMKSKMKTLWLEKLMEIKTQVSG